MSWAPNTILACEKCSFKVPTNFNRQIIKYNDRPTALTPNRLIVDVLLM